LLPVNRVVMALSFSYGEWCNMLCTSGFVDHFMFSQWSKWAAIVKTWSDSQNRRQNKEWHGCSVEFTRWRHWGQSCCLQLQACNYTTGHTGL